MESAKPATKPAAAYPRVWLAETELIEHASHGDSGGTSAILRDAGREELERTDAVYGAADDARLHD